MACNVVLTGVDAHVSINSRTREVQVSQGMISSTVPDVFFFLAHMTLAGRLLPRSCSQEEGPQHRFPCSITCEVSTDEDNQNSSIPVMR